MSYRNFNEKLNQLSNSEILVLTENTRTQYSKVSNCKITFKDIDKTDRIKLKVTDFNTDKEFIPLKIFRKNIIYYYNTDATNKLLCSRDKKLFLKTSGKETIQLY